LVAPSAAAGIQSDVTRRPWTEVERRSALAGHDDGSSDNPVSYCLGVIFYAVAMARRGGGARLRDIFATPATKFACRPGLLPQTIAFFEGLKHPA
jgi:hypothetical protein